MATTTDDTTIARHLHLPVGGHRTGTPHAHALVDVADAALAEMKWSLNRGGYAYRKVRVNGRQRVILLHRELLGLVHGDGLEGDHINGNRLDNRRCNLRVGPRALNGQNIVRDGGSSRYRGVSWHKRGRKWMASCWVSGENHYLGLFESEADAAEAARVFRVARMPWTNEGRQHGNVTTERIHVATLG